MKSTRNDCQPLILRSRGDTCFLCSAEFNQKSDCPITRNIGSYCLRLESHSFVPQATINQFLWVGRGDSAKHTDQRATQAETLASLHSWSYMNMQNKGIPGTPVKPLDKLHLILSTFPAFDSKKNPYWGRVVPRVQNSESNKYKWQTEHVY